MCKKLLRGVQRVTTAHVLNAQKMARDLVARETKGSGDMENAMRRLEAKYGVPFQFLWSLRYRPPHDVLMGMFERLQHAYERQLDEKLKRLEHERQITETKSRIAARLAGAADALVRQEG